MAISYNTGTTATVNNSANNHGTITVPAGVLTGDVVFVYVFGFAVSNTTSGGVTLTSTATAPTAIGSAQFLQSVNPGIAIVGQPFYFVAGASDPGATLTYTFTGLTSSQYWFDVGLVAYTGASTTGIPDCQNGTKSFSGSGTGAITTPSTTTNTDGDWQIQLIGQDPAGSPTVVTPGGLTSRQTVLTAANSGVLLNIADSNGSVGSSGTSIGGTSWTVTGSTTGNTWQTAFTVGLAPASSGGPPPLPAQQQSLALLKTATQIPQFAQQAAPPPLLPAPAQATAFLQRGLPQSAPSPQQTPPAPPVPAPQQAVTLLRLGLPVSAQSPQVPQPVPPLPAPQHAVTLLRLGLPQTLPSPQVPPPPPPGPAPSQGTSLLLQGLPQQQAANQQTAAPPPITQPQQALRFLLQGLPATAQSPALPVAAPVSIYTAGQPQAATMLLLQGLPQQQAAAQQTAPPAPLPAAQQSALFLQRGMATPGHYSQAAPVAPPVVAQPGQPQALNLLQQGLPVSPQSPQVPPPPPPGIQPQNATALLVQGLLAQPQWNQIPAPPPPVAQPQHAATLLRLGLPTPGHWNQAPPAIIPPPPPAQPPQATTLLRRALPTPGNWSTTAAAPPGPGRAAFLIFFP